MSATPFHVFKETDGRAMAADLRHQMETSPVDLSHLIPVIERYEDMGRKEDLVASYATRPEADARAAELNKSNKQPHVRYWAEYCNF